MGEHLLHTVNCHVFYVEPCTKKDWVACCDDLINVCFYHDVPRNIFRIIAIYEKNNKVIINSTMHPSTYFIKSSQKFGQWTDYYSHVIYGVGFDDEEGLSKFVSCFEDVKKQSAQDVFTNSLLLLKDVQSNEISSVEQIKYENDRLKIALAQSCCNAKKWESELQMLRNTNNRLKNAIDESVCNVDKWNQQISCLKEENAKLRTKLCELERNGSTKEVLEEQNNEMRLRLVDALQKLAELEKEIENLKVKLSFYKDLDCHKFQDPQKHLCIEEENDHLKENLNRLRREVEDKRCEDVSCHVTYESSVMDRSEEIHHLQKQFNSKINELFKINDRLASII